MGAMKDLLFSVTASNFRWDYYKGTGSGGQKKNKVENCCRCTHIASGAVACSEEGRSKDHNRRNAFLKCVNTPEFKRWHTAEVMRRTGEAQKIEAEVGRKLVEETQVEVEGGKGWERAPESLQVTFQDVKNMRLRTLRRNLREEG